MKSVVAFQRRIYIQHLAKAAHDGGKHPDNSDEIRFATQEVKEKLFSDPELAVAQLYEIYQNQFYVLHSIQDDTWAYLLYVLQQKLSLQTDIRIMLLLSFLAETNPEVCRTICL